MGKGSKRRPLSVSEERFAAEWERIFRKRPQKAVEPRTETPPQGSGSREKGD